MSNSFLQHHEWLNFQKSLGREVFEYDQDGIKAGIIKLSLPFGKSYLYIPHGPEMDFNSMIGGMENPVRNFLQYLKELAHREKAIFVKAEPLADNIAQILVGGKFSAIGGPAFGWKKSKKEIQPSKTAVIDLAKTDEELLAGMHHKTRYNIKVAEKNDIAVKESRDTKEFWELMEKTTKRDKFSSHTEYYYEKLLAGIHSGEMWTKIFTAYGQSQPLASAIILFYEGTGYYLHGASDYRYRNLMAPYKLHWEIIKYLKAQAFKRYDLWGIDARRWPGVTRFKLGWLGSLNLSESGNGRVIEYPGSFDLTISWQWRFAYKLARKFFL